jgi:cystathionine gamma-lyase
MASVYGGTYRYLTQVAPSLGVTVSFANDIQAELASLISKNEGRTKLVWIESPSNPTLSLVDIQAVADIAHDKGILVVVDNTFLSPYIQNPLKHDADLVLHSVTKYINGHSVRSTPECPTFHSLHSSGSYSYVQDVLMGAVAFNNPDILNILSFIQNAAGSVPSPFDCWLAHRGVKTLHLRALAASRNALTVAQILEQSPHVVSVNYPGLSGHPQRRVAVKQHRDGLGGGMISFRIRGGSEAASKFCKMSRFFTLAESLGGVESLCEVPALMTHKAMPKDVREESGIYDDLIRLSVGIEDAEDLKADLVQALEKAVCA